MSTLTTILHKEWVEGAVLCPFHGDTRASAQVYANGKFYCHGCGAKAGSLVDLVRQLEYADERYDTGMSLAREQLERVGYVIPAARAAPKARREAARDAILVMTTYAGLANEMTSDVYFREVAQERGLQDPRALGLSLTGTRALARTKGLLEHRVKDMTAALIEAGIIFDEEYGHAFRLGKRLMIPERRTGEVIYYQARATIGLTKTKYLNPPAISRPLFGWDSLMRTKSPFVLIAEGPFDVLPFIEAGYAALAIMGSVPIDMDPGIFRQRPVVVGLDNDIPGRAKAKLMTEGLLAAGVNAINLPPPTKDYGEWVVEEGVRTVAENIIWELPS